MSYRFNPPPTWPAVPKGWSPPPGWEPPADWPKPPESWSLWVPDNPSATAGHQNGSSVFGARKRLRQAESDLAAADHQNQQLRQAINGETAKVVALEAQLREVLGRNQGLISQLEDLASRYASLRGKDAVQMDREILETRRQLTQLIKDADTQRTANIRQQADAADALVDIRKQVDNAQAALRDAQRQVVETQETILLQEAGIYEYKHRLADAVAYKAALEQLKDAIKSAAKNNHAITATTNWTVNNSAAEGQRMVRDFSKLMLRAYNNEADNCVKSMRPYRLESSKDRLNKVREIISRLGKTMHINISANYHGLRLRELELTSDYLAKAEEEKERVRAERERQRDEQQARREFEREKARLAKEMSHWQTAMQKWTTAGELTKTAEAESKLEEIREAIKGVEEREANIRTGWVYVISNVGSFGERIIKIGLTRRLDPMERVRELGDASVPFKFDVHAFIFNEDAVSLETRLHQRLSDQRVNRVNLRREFFYATPAEVLAILRDMGLQDNLVDFVQEPEAQEWRTSQRLTTTARTDAVQDLDALTA